VQKYACSADSHVLEPNELWLDLPAALRDRGPRTVVEESRELVFFDGQFIKRDPIDFAESIRPPGAASVIPRIADLDAENIWAEVLYPSAGLWIYLTKDGELATACAQIYNDWLLDSFMKASPRFVGVALLPVADVKMACKELERVASLGYKAVLLPCSPPNSLYNSDEFEPLWRAAEEANLRLCFHVGTGDFPIVERGSGGAVINYVETFYPPQRAVSYLVAAGVLDRHPSLHAVFVEGGASWLPALMERMDEGYKQHHRFVDPVLSALPSDIIARQVHATFQHDRALLSTLDITGLGAVMWGSDYPHLEGTWPNSKQILDDLFSDSADDVRQAVTCDNVMELFNIPAPS
jgi:predicted TIM-barrel fold metal-dependent hydrolase